MYNIEVSVDSTTHLDAAKFPVIAIVYCICYS